MDILIQTRQSIYHISWNGIKKVETVNWDKLKSTFDGLLMFQTDKAKEELSTPVFRQLNQIVKEGSASADANNQAWRKTIREKSKVETVIEGWANEGSGSLDRTMRALKNAKLESSSTRWEKNRY